MSSERILVVDDDPGVLEMCTRVLTEEGYQVHGAGGGRAALACLEERTFDLLLTDVKMPDVDGLAVLRQARELDPDMAAVIITAYSTLQNAIDALRAGARGFILKPFDLDELLSTVKEALKERRQEQENLLLRARLPILEIGQTLMVEGDAVHLAGRLLESVVRQIDVDWASLMLLDEATEELTVAGVVGLPAEVVGTTRALVDFWRDLLPREEPLVLGGERDRDPSLQALVGGPDVVCVCVPLRARKRALGVLNLSRLPGGAPFAASDLNLLSIVGRQIATALDNAGLYEEISASRDYFRTVLDSLHDEVVVVDRDYLITDVNAAFLRTTGYKPEGVLGQHCYQVSHRRDEPCDDPECPCPVAEVWRTGRSARGLHIHYGQAGEKAYVDVAASPLCDEQGQIIQVIEVCRDVTAEWQLQNRLATVEALGRELVLSRDETQIAQTVVDAAERVLEFQVCSLWLLDKERKALIRRAATAAEKALDMPPLPLDNGRGITVAVAQSGEAIYLPDVRQDPRYIELGMPFTLSELCVPLGAGERVIGVLNAESEKLDAFDEDDWRLFSTLADQAALALENARLYETVARGKREWEATFDAITDGISIHDGEFNIVRANQSLARTLNVPLERLIGQKCYRFFQCEETSLEWCPHRQMLEDGAVHTAELDDPRLGGTFLISAYPLLNAQGEIAASVHVVRDITQRKRDQAQLIQSEKLAALGRLSASLAHEINNPLQALRSGLGLLKRPDLEEKKRRQYLTVASREVDRLIGLVERMVGFYRPSADTPLPVNIHALLDEILLLAGKKLQHSHITIQRDWAGELPPIDAIANQLKQVFLNLILNASDAMPDGGTLTVSTGCVPDGPGIYIRFADTGHGIALQYLNRIFEPFYTTRPQGSGLGLAISYNIVQQHGGRIEVESQPGQGTTLTVTLPIG